MSIIVNSRSIFGLSWKNAQAHWQLKIKENYIRADTITKNDKNYL